MFVHTHQAGNNRMVGEVHALSARRNRCGGSAADGRDPAVVDDDGLVFGGRCAGAVNYANVHQSDDRGIDADERLRTGK